MQRRFFCLVVLAVVRRQVAPCQDCGLPSGPNSGIAFVERLPCTGFWHSVGIVGDRQRRPPRLITIALLLQRGGLDEVDGQETVDQLGRCGTGRQPPAKSIIGSGVSPAFATCHCVEQPVSCGLDPRSKHRQRVEERAPVKARLRFFADRRRVAGEGFEKAAPPPLMRRVIAHWQYSEGSVYRARHQHLLLGPHRPCLGPSTRSPLGVSSSADDRR